MQRGVYRLRLPLPWPGVPHCNAWAVSAGDGFVLFDTGMHQPGSMADLERALEMCGLRLADTKLVVCTHAHSDHCGQAATIVEQVGCELWMHPSHELMTRMVEDPQAVLARRLEVARQSGVPEEALRRYEAQRGTPEPGIAGPIAPDRELVSGVSVESDLGEWVVYETPGHSPSHVCLFQPERRLLISGDHLLGRISLYFEFGYSPNPVGEFLSSLDVVERLGARLCLAGHGRTFTDVHAHIAGNRSSSRSTCPTCSAPRAMASRQAFEVVTRVHGELALPAERPLAAVADARLPDAPGGVGSVRRIPGDPERWTA